ncbi:ATP-binding cassette domain-containing protein, partial [Streptosporangium canum]|uniref:ABC transporter ATP-binding protein n=1 Tax=Streptosporangium canum TaxID=324952 RepID=UPI0034472581
GRALLGEHTPGVALSGTVEVRGRIGYLPQHPASVLNPVRRVGAVLREIARRHAPDGAAAERVASVLRRAGLPAGEDLLRRYPHQLSGGQQQRLVLAQTLLTVPSAIVADEPTTGQDAITRGEVAGELRGLARQGIAVVLLSHDLDVVRALADQVVVLHGGRVTERGPAEDVFTRPGHDYTRRLLAARLPATPRPAPEVPPPAGVSPGPAVPRPVPVSPLPVPAVPPGRVRIEAAGLTAGHRSDPVLDDVSLRVAAGQCLALVGRSGSGKTTLARCVAGLHEPARGTVLLDGRPLAPSLSRRRREDVARVQYVFQDAHASFDPGRTVAEQVSRTAVRLRGLGPGRAREAALDMLGRVGLGPAAAARRPGGL